MIVAQQDVQVDPTAGNSILPEKISSQERKHAIKSEEPSLEEDMYFSAGDCLAQPKDLYLRIKKLIVKAINVDEKVLIKLLV